MSKDTGGSAFPWKTQYAEERGMSLRDYFAAKAMQGLLTKQTHTTKFNPEDDATYCYRVADAMLAERDK